MRHIVTRINPDKKLISSGNIPDFFCYLKTVHLLGNDNVLIFVNGNLLIVDAVSQ